MDSVASWHAETLGAAACGALEKNGFRAEYVSDGNAAVERVMSFVREGMTVGIGGSMTLRGLGIPERLKAAGAKVLDHNAPGLTPSEKAAIRAAQHSSDLFLSSTNALTLEGELVNVDGNGNRVSALAYGPGRVIVVVGVNKIVRDEKAGYERVRAIAAPMNNRRLGNANPCVKTGFCVDCNVESRSCRIYQTLKKRPLPADFLVIVVGESLGY